MDSISGDAEQLVPCRKVTPSALRTLKVCKECEHHIDIEEVRAPGQLADENNPKGLPPSYRVVCGLPMKVQVVNLIREK